MSASVIAKSLTLQSESTQTPTADLHTDPSGPVPPSSKPAEDPPTVAGSGKPPALFVRILCADVTTHLDGVHRQRGGIGRQGFDEKQSDLRKFFGGGGGDGATKSPEK